MSGGLKISFQQHQKSKSIAEGVISSRLKGLAIDQDASTIPFPANVQGLHR
jgi:hypothetical protein